MHNFSYLGIFTGCVYPVITRVRLPQPVDRTAPGPLSREGKG